MCTAARYTALMPLFHNIQTRRQTNYLKTQKDKEKAKVNPSQPSLILQFGVEILYTYFFHTRLLHTRQWWPWVVRIYFHIYIELSGCFHPNLVHSERSKTKRNARTRGNRNKKPKSSCWWNHCFWVQGKRGAKAFLEKTWKNEVIGIPCIYYEYFFLFLSLASFLEMRILLVHLSSKGDLHCNNQRFSHLFVHS